MVTVHSHVMSSTPSKVMVIISFMVIKVLSVKIQLVVNVEIG